MNRNVESHFAELPGVDIERSIFDRSATHKTSFNTGELIPFFWDEVLPGDTFNVSTSLVARLQTLLTPIMDNMYLDTYYFFVPNRLTWEHWKQFMGENSDSAWLPAVTYNMPRIASPQNGWNVGTIADYLGVPTGVEFYTSAGTQEVPLDNLAPDALLFRAYALICNEWFRDQNLTDPLNIPVGDSDQTGSNGTSYVNDVANGGAPFKVAKYHDYFTSCLPSPQKGPAVSFNFDSDIEFTIPDVPSLTGTPGFPVSFASSPLYSFEDGKAINPMIGLNSNASSNNTRFVYGTLARTNSDSDIFHNYQFGNLSASNVDPVYDDTNLGNASTFKVQNAYVDMTDLANQFVQVNGVSFTINELRLAFQLQKFYEKNARGGSRYRELLKMHFGVTSPDARMMVPEYLGGHRVPIQIHQIVNTAQSSGENLGDVGAMSNTSDIHEDFIKSFTEHGYIIGVCCVRYDHSYPQGLSRQFVHKSSLDYYWPVFANIGEQPVYKWEIDATIRADEDRTAVFGYQEAWASYRYLPARVSGELRPGISNSLASWHLSDYYSSQPALSDSWIREDKSNVDRVLAVTSSVSHQIFADFYVQNNVTRAMPMYSVPGLIDHH